MPTWRERRRSRRRTEEVMSWVLLPLVLVVVWSIGFQLYKKLFDAPPSASEPTVTIEPPRR